MPLAAKLASRKVVTATGKKATVKVLLDELSSRVTTVEDIEAAGKLHVDASPAMIEGDAQWLGLLRDLAALSPLERLEVFAHVARDRDGRFQPSANDLWERDLDLLGAAARPWALDLVTRQLAPDPPSFGEGLASSAAAVLAAHPGDGPSADDLLRLAGYYASPRATRTLVAAASPAARVTWLHDRLGVEARCRGREASAHRDRRGRAREPRSVAACETGAARRHRAQRRGGIRARSRGVVVEEVPRQRRARDPRPSADRAAARACPRRHVQDGHVEARGGDDSRRGQARAEDR